MSKNKSVKRVNTACIAKSYKIKVTTAAGTTSSNTIFTTSIANILTKLTFTFVIKFRRHRAVTNTSFVSLENTYNLIKIMRTDSTTTCGTGSTRSTRTYIRISSAVKVEHCTLSTFKKNVFTANLVHFCSHINTHAHKAVAIFIKIFLVFTIKLCHFFRPVKVGKTNTITMCLFGISDSHSASCSSNRAFTCSITFFIHLTITWQNELSSVRNKYSAFPIDSVVLEHLEFIKKCFGINYHTRTKKNFFIGIKDSRRNLMKRILLTVYNNCMSGIWSACIANYILCVLCKVINNFTFSFISPLGANYNYIHYFFLRRFLKIARLLYSKSICKFNTVPCAGSFGFKDINTIKIRIVAAFLIR